jgi:transposase-like protein
MKEYPMTLEEFEKEFGTEKACRDYIVSIRWPDGFLCPRCGHNKAWPIGDALFQCTSCRYRTSIIAGTIFQDTHKSLTMWFRAMWWVASQKSGASALGLQKVLGLGSYETAWSWLHKIRHAMVRPGREKLSGFVEVDDTYIGGEHEGKQGRGSENKALVAIGVEVNDGKIGRIRLSRVANASGASLVKFVQESVEKGSTVNTDGWQGYNGLTSEGYIHEVTFAKHTEKTELLPHVHLIVSLIKRWLLGTHQGAVRGKHLDYYLDEYTFRFNRRTSHYRGKLFYRLIQNAVAVEPITYEGIVNREENKKT